MAVIISILSDQLIPNVLFIKHWSTKLDRHVFITTAEMESENKMKSVVLAGALSIDYTKITKLIVDANTPSLILDNLKHFQWSEDEKYIVNITGGNKIMSQMVSLYFSKYETANIYYWPIERDFIEQLHPVIKSIRIEKNITLNLETYFKAHGYSLTRSNKLSYPFEKANFILKSVLDAGTPELVEEITLAKKEHYLASDKEYLTGKWFEEWTYYMLKETFKIKDELIAFNIKLKSIYTQRKIVNDNEIDIAFIYKNKLYVWELKVLGSRSLKGNAIGNVIYKISSVTQSLGLQATSVVLILAPFGTSKERRDYINDIIKLMRIKKVFSLEDLLNKNQFISEIKKMIHYE